MADEFLLAGRTILIVGAGSIGRRHLSNLRRLAPHSRIVVMRRHETADLPEADLVIGDIGAALAERPFAAIVANPAPLHLSVAQQLAEQRCHLLVEKPLSDGLTGVDLLLETCTARGVVLMVGYNLRFLPALQKLAELVAEKAIGRVLHLRVEVGQYLPDWRPDADYRQSVTARRELGGGALLELSHEIDVALWLLGPAAGVSACVQKISDLEIDTDDSVDLTLDFDSGARASVHMDLLQRVPRRQIVVTGSDGSLAWDYFADELHIGRKASAGWQEVETEKLADRNEMYISELREFLHCAVTGAAPAVDGRAGRNVMGVIEAARRSNEQNQLRVFVECL